MNFNQVHRYRDTKGSYVDYNKFKALQDDFLLLLKATSKMHSFKGSSEAAKEGEEQFLALLEKYRDNL